MYENSLFIPPPRYRGRPDGGKAYLISVLFRFRERDKMRIRKFVSSDGLEIWVGMDDASNDELTLHAARANDLWFHVSGAPGSHVLLRCADILPDKESIREAAGIAAYFSKMRRGGKVPVHYVLAKNVSKPRGAKAGTVQIHKEKKIIVRPGLIEEAKGKW